MDDVLAALQVDIQPLGLTLHAGIWDCAQRRWMVGEGLRVPDRSFEVGLVLCYGEGSIRWRAINRCAVSVNVSASASDVVGSAFASICRTRSNKRAST